MAKLLGFLLSISAIGLLFYGHPAGVDIVAAYAWVVAVLSVVAAPIFFLIDSTKAFPKRAEAVRAASKLNLSWVFLRMLLIGGGLAFHGLVVTAAFFLALNSLLVMVMTAAAETRLKRP
ncbi:hypothetical protein [Stutzerimonas xanthomarina]|uniref:hypothetical protein n=1 Tax=Stutzerimonas xanthomarina TaxID=271420 RepID=UPI003AA7F746